MSELANPLDSEVPRYVRLNGERYVIVMGAKAIPPGERVSTIIDNLKSVLDAPAQVDVLENIIKPGLERHGTE